MAPQRLRVPAEDAGARLDVWLAGAMRVSRGEVRRLLEAGGVEHEGRVMRLRDKGARVAARDVLVVRGGCEDQAPVPRPDIPLKVVSQGEGWLIADKPAGVGVHPLQTNQTRTLLNAVAARYPQIVGVGEGAGEELRSGVVHRLDVDTSGCVAFGLDEPTWAAMRTAIRERSGTKRYRALVRGVPASEGQSVQRLTIAQHRPARVRVVERSSGVPHNKTRRCSLAWRVLEPLAHGRASLIEVDLHTGFLHQIRVMMAHLGHPLLGDATYGDPPTHPPTDPAPRHMLHAHTLHLGPARGSVEPPDDFQRLHALLRPTPPPLAI